MKLLLKSVTAIVLSLSTLTALAAPTYLTTHNNTGVESNAFIAGSPSPYPTPANATRQVYWNLVRLACWGHTTADGQCSAMIKMATNTANPIEIGTVYLTVATGEINPKQLSNNGYTFVVNNIGETTITKNAQ
ncbi:MAG: hypothetical protein ACHP65_05665 [Legionellales bacterium]